MRIRDVERLAGSVPFRSAQRLLRWHITSLRSLPFGLKSYIHSPVIGAVEKLVLSKQLILKRLKGWPWSCFRVRCDSAHGLRKRAYTRHVRMPEVHREGLMYSSFASQVNSIPQGLWAFGLACSASNGVVQTDCRQRAKYRRGKDCRKGPGCPY
jgi:hypothetical protein